MNIKQAKEEIKHAIAAYLAKDEYGQYCIPVTRQRPLLLMGAPGIGKTAVMEQVARECGVGLVAYSITHHTRQSAIGLPFISQKQYGGKTYAVTEYTMSEIIAAVYDKMEETGLREGILFLDEINCVSETLAPAMLQFLQAKTFGSHKVPEGWVIVAAGNPPEYNKSVREFDVVTLDRVKKIDVEPDFAVWKEYAWKQGIHGAVLSYLEIKKNHFYAMETTVDGKRFATARGWEDLSNILQVYEALGIPAEEGLVYQYLQHRKIAKDFANYLDLYEKYRTDYRIADILAGQYSKNTVEKLQEAPFDERLSVMGLMLSRLTQDFMAADAADLRTVRLHGFLKEIKERFDSPYCVQTPWETLWDSVLEEQQAGYERERKANLLDKQQGQAYVAALQRLEAYGAGARKEGLRAKETVFAWVKTQFAEVVAEREHTIAHAAQALDHAFAFLEETFGTGQEMVIFLTELTANYYSVKFISENGSEPYYRYNKELLFEEKQKSILEDIEQAKTELDLLF